MHDFITIGGTTRDISFFTDQGVLLDNKRDILRQKLLAFESGAKIKVDRFYYSFGGGAANAAVCLTNFGLKTACLAPVGDDENGREIIANLKRRGVDAKLVEKKTGAQSGSSFILIDPSGERIIFAQRGANKSLAISSRQLGSLRQAKNIYIASLTGNWLKNLRAIFSAVAPDGPSVFWNPGMTQYAHGPEKLGPFLKKTKVLACNKDEAIQFVLASKKNKYSQTVLNREENLVKIIHSFGPKVAVLTLGDDGVIVYDGRKIYRRFIKKDKKRVDTTGIGDVFNSSFAAGMELFRGDIDKALDLSLKNAAAKVAHLGAQVGLLTRRDILKDIKKK